MQDTSAIKTYNDRKALYHKGAVKMSEFKNLGEFIHTAYLHTKHGINDDRLNIKSAGMNEATSADGGYLVSKPIVGPLMESAQQKSNLWRKATKLHSSKFGAKVPYLSETIRKDSMSGKMAYWIGEGSSKTTDYPRMGQVDMQLRKLCVLLPVTDELLQDSQLLNEWLETFVAQRIAWVVDRAILYGDPATSMGGIMGAGSGNGVIGVASADPLTSTVISNFQAKLAPANESKAEWYVSKENWNDLTDQAQSFMDKHMLVIDNGEWYLFGHKVNVLEQLNNTCDIILGDFSQYAVVSMGDAIKDSSIQFKFDTDQTYIRWVIRLAGDSFGQVYTLEDGSEVGTFIVPSDCEAYVSSSSSSSSSESIGNVSTSSSSESSSSFDRDTSSSESTTSLSSQSDSSHSTESVSSASTESESSSSGDNITVSGTLTPDATGDYYPSGTYKGNIVYTNGTYYVWSDMSEWIISTAVGGVQTNFWANSDPSGVTSGTYSPYGTYTGDATIA